jgi:AraC-like DNA-binding protein
MWWGGPWEMHGWRVGRPGTLLLIVEFFPTIFGSIPAAEPFSHLAYMPFLFPEIRPQLQPRSRRDVLDLLGEGRGLLRKSEKRGSMQPLAIRMEFLLLLMRIFEKHRLTLSSNPGMDHGTVKQIMGVIDHVRRRPGDRMSLEQAAEQACMGRTRFTQTFRRVAGVHFCQYVLKARLEKAHLEIIKGGAKISQIASQCGFTVSHFIRMYQRQFGHTPGRERKKVA